MNLTDFREHPAIKTHFSEVARAIDEHLVTRLLIACAGSEGHSDHAEAEIGAAKALAALIQDFRSINGITPPPKPVSIGKPLHRFDKTEPQKSES